MVKNVASFIARVSRFVSTTKEQPIAPPHLKIVTQTWTGWTRKQPKPIKKTVLLIGDTQEIPLRGGYTLSVISVSHNSVTLSVDGLGLKRGKDVKEKTINLLGCKSQTFSLEFNETVKLYTCSMDGGTFWTITYY